MDFPPSGGFSPRRVRRSAKSGGAASAAGAADASGAAGLAAGGAGAFIFYDRGIVAEGLHDKGKCGRRLALQRKACMTEELW